MDRVVLSYWIKVDVLGKLLFQEESIAFIFSLSLPSFSMHLKCFPFHEDSDFLGYPGYFRPENLGGMFSFLLDDRISGLFYLFHAALSIPRFTIALSCVIIDSLRPSFGPKKDLRQYVQKKHLCLTRKSVKQWHFPKCILPLPLHNNCCSFWSSFLSLFM